MKDKSENILTPQQKRILQYIEQKGYITRLSAMLDCGISNLTAAISIMRSKGYNIVTQRVRKINRYGEVIHYARYVLGGAKDAK